MEDLAIKLREVYGYSQESVAYQMGINQAAYSKKERGETRFTFACIESLAKVYQFSFMERVKGLGFKSPIPPLAFWLARKG